MKFKTESELITFIVNNNGQDVRENLAKALNNKSIEGWRNEDVIRKLITLYNNGYDISGIVNVPVLNLRETFPEFKAPEGKFAGGLNFGDILLSVAGALVAGSPVGNILFPQQTNTGAQPIPATNEQQNKSWFDRNKKIIIGGGIVFILLLIVLLLIRRKK